MKNKYLILVSNSFQDIIGNFQLEIKDLSKMPNAPALEEVAAYYVKDIFGERKEDPISDEDWYDFQIINLETSKVVVAETDLNINEV